MRSMSASSLQFINDIILFLSALLFAGTLLN